ncbi:hypothetical protein MNBD_ALPHA09-2291 [hydrothermal vent metagenome]|uniref:Uncharacterized protein n=1 Tax=hydrothermal vent metagenome TaxID=652676 RepID=A0A3B0TV40_9ZZZZ
MTHQQGTGATVVTDIDIPFIRLVLIFFKVYLAMIPALILVGLVFAAIASISGGIFGFGAMMMGPTG